MVGGPNFSTQRLSHIFVIFLNHVPDTVDENTILVTFGFVSLYTNIHAELGIEAVKFRTEKYPNLLHNCFPQKNCTSRFQTWTCKKYG